MTRRRAIAMASLALVGAVYLYYTEIKPVVIFGLRSDYAHAARLPLLAREQAADRCDR